MAIKGSGAVISVGSAVSGSAIVVTGATAASPCVLTTAVQAFAKNDIIVVAGVVGMTQLNNRAFPVDTTASPSTKKATLVGVDSTLYTAYASGGTAQKYTMTPIGTVTDIKGYDGQASEIDSTHLQSVSKEYLLGLPDAGNVTLDVIADNTDAGQKYLRIAQEQQLLIPFSILLSNGNISAFMGFVKQFSFDGVKPDGLLTGSISLRVSNRPTWFA